jgi:PAS domain S-box-containing protein
MLIASVIIGPFGYASLIEQSSTLQHNLSERVSFEIRNYFEERANELRFLDEVYALGTLDSSEQQDVLNIFLLNRRVYQEMVLLDTEGQEKIRLSRDAVFTESDLGNRAEMDEFLYPLENGEIYFSPVRYDEALREPIITISLPLYDPYTGKIVSVLVADIRFKVIWDILLEIKLSGISQEGIYILDEKGQVIAHGNPTVVISKTLIEIPEEGVRMDGLSGDDLFFATQSFYLGEQEFIAVVEQPAQDVLKLATDSLLLVIFLMLIILASAAWLAIFLARQIVSPIDLLAKSAQGISAGDFSQRVEVASKDEIGQLAESFNVMTEKLEKTLSSLEAEVEHHKKAKEELALSEARYRSSIEDSPGLVCSFLPGGEITFANHSYAKYYQRTPEEMVGVNFLSLLPEEERAGILEKVNNINATNPVGVITHKAFSPWGTLRQQRWSNRALFNESGEVIGYQAFGEDIEAEYKMQEVQSTLYRIAQAAYRKPSMEDLYAFIYELIQETIPAKNFYLALYNDTTGLLEPSYFVDEKDEKPLPRKLGNSPSDYVLKTAISLRCTPEEFLALEPDIKAEEIVGTPPAVWLGVPLMADQRAIGVMAVQDYENEDAFGKAEQEFLELISSSIANTLARQSAQAETVALAQTNALLFRAAQELSETLDLKELYKNLYNLIIKVMDCDTFILSEYDPEEEMIYCDFIIHQGQEEEPSALPPIPLEPEGQGTQSLVIRKGEALIINDLAEQVEKTDTSYYVDDDGKVRDHSDVPEGEEPSRSLIATPLKLEDQVIGVIQVLSHKTNTYTQEHLHFLQALSFQISLSVKNARLFNQAQAEIALRKEAEDNLKKFNLELEGHVQERTAEINKRIRIVEKLNAGLANILHDLNIANEIAERNARQLEEANAELEAFSYSVSHDLRAPLRHIEGFTQLLFNSLGDELDMNAERYLSNIVKSTARMGNLINDLLLLSRAGRTELHTKPLDFNATVESVRADLFDEVSERQIKWKLASLPIVHADGGLIKIVWTNLIENAIKYTRQRKEAVIEIGILPPDDDRAQKGYETFFVRDNGVGFDDAYIDKLFGVFQRLHQQEEFEGNGIGLATVRRIIHRHGGEVWAEGDLDQGASFFFTLPKNNDI